MSVCPDVWRYRYQVRTLGFGFDSDMAVFRGQGDELALYGVAPLHDACVTQLRRLGRVSLVIVPNPFHHVFATDALQHFPDARLYVTPGLAKKRNDLVPYLLPEQKLELWGGEIQLRLLEGIPRVREIALFHQPSRSIAVTDYFMNVQESDSFPTRIAMKLEGVWHNPAMPRMFRFMVRNRPDLRASIADLQAWNAERILPAHGDVIEGSDAVARLLASV